MLFKKRVVRMTFDIYVLIYSGMIQCNWVYFVNFALYYIAFDTGGERASGNIRTMTEICTQTVQLDQ
jgi:hypothetical protein